MSKVTADKLVQAYIKIRNARQQLLTSFEEEDNALKNQQEMVGERLLELCKDTGADSIKTAYGTVSRTVKTRYWPSDWGAMYNFIKEHDALHLLEQRLHQTNMKAYLEDHPDQLPRGLNSDSKYSVSVRKPR